MRIFVSSVNKDFAGFRGAAAEAIETLGHAVVRAEEFSASPASPQQACLAAVRESDLVVLLLGSRYGPPQASGLSATHEEYREARESRPVIVLLQRAVEPEPEQAAFIEEVQGWEQGHFTVDFGDADELRRNLIRALHDFVLADAGSPVNEAELASRAEQLASANRRTGSAALSVAIASGPTRSVLRPAELENPDLQRFLMGEALTGVHAVLDPAFGTTPQVSGDTIELIQRDGPGWVRVDETGNVVVGQPAIEHRDQRSMITVLIEETITERMIRALGFAHLVLDRIDPEQRLTHIAPVAALHDAGVHPWRTRSEHERSPNQAPMGNNQALLVAALTPPVRRRPALVHDVHRLAEDLVVRLRREIRR